MVWLWAVLGWGVVSLIAAMVFHRMRQSDPVAVLALANFEARLAAEFAQHEGVRFLGLLPDRLVCLLAVDDQETPVALHRLYEQYSTQPESFSAAVSEVLLDLRELALERVEDTGFARAAELLMPQVRTRQWVEARGRFGDSALAAKSLGADLAVVYVLDDKSSMVFVCRAHLRNWGREVDDIHNLAVANLATRSMRLEQMAVDGDAPVVLQTGDGYDATRVLLLEERDDVVVALPDRDTLWVGSAQTAAMSELRATAAAIALASAHPISPMVYKFSGGQLAELRAEG